MSIENLKYTKEHEWIGKDGDLWAVGISDHAQGQLGDVTFVELPEEGRVVTKGEEVAAVESVKAASDVYSPATGTVSVINTALEDKPELVNEAAEGDGWFFKLSGVNEADLAGLMDATAYAAFCEAEDH